jgi:hypothetical protein
MADEISAGLRAKELLDSPQLRETFDAVEARFTKQWKQAETRDEREMAWAKVQAVDEVWRVLRATLTNGEVAAATLDSE